MTRRFSEVLAGARPRVGSNDHPEVSRSRHSASEHTERANPLRGSNGKQPSGKSDNAFSYQKSFAQDRLLSVLLRDFGGEARCVDLNGKLRSFDPAAYSMEASLCSVRSTIRSLESQGKISAEAIGSGVLVARITVNGASS